MTDMPEYIDRKALQEMLNAKSEMAQGTPKQVFCAVAKMVELLPAADVVPVVHGEWERSPKQYSYYQYRCSACGCDNYSHITRNGVVKVMKFCPNCGAKMDGGTPCRD